MELYGYEFIRESDLTHHGIKGQKWGIRRFQNEDGSLKTAGKERYGEGGETHSISGSARARLTKEVRVSAREQKKAKQAKAIEDGIANAKSASEMRRAVEAKAKADIRAKQNPLSRTLNDITGYNNTLAKRVVSDVSMQIRAKDIKNQRSAMTRGEKFIDFFTSNSMANANNSYTEKGFTKLNSEYEKYRDSGGIKRSKKTLDSERRMAANRQAHERLRQQSQAERQYERERKQREEDMRRVAAQMNYMNGVYERAKNRNS